MLYRCQLCLSAFLEMFLRFDSDTFILWFLLPFQIKVCENHWLWYWCHYVRERKEREVDVEFQGGNSGGIDRSMAGNGKCSASGFLRPCFHVMHLRAFLLTKQIKQVKKSRGINTPGYFLYKKIKLIRPMLLNMFRFWLHLEREMLHQVNWSSPCTTTWPRFSFSLTHYV